VANYLNERGIKTKRGTALWRATSVRALIDNRIYLGYMRMGDTYSPKQDHLQIIGEATWEKCQETVKGRATCLKHEMKVPERTDTFDEANAETKHMIIARLVERIEINHDYEVEIKFRISVEQYMRIAA